jgi:hypothetical protein
MKKSRDGTSSLPIKAKTIASITTIILIKGARIKFNGESSLKSLNTKYLQTIN